MKTTTPNPMQRIHNLLKNQLDKKLKTLKDAPDQVGRFTGQILGVTLNETFNFNTLPADEKWYYGLKSMSYMRDDQDYLLALRIVMSESVLPNAQSLQDTDNAHQYYHVLREQLSKLDDDLFDENDCLTLSAHNRCIGYDRHYDMLAVVAYHDKLPRLQCLTVFVGDYDAACDHPQNYYDTLYNLLGTMLATDDLQDKPKHIITAALDEIDTLSSAMPDVQPGLPKSAHPQPRRA